MEADINTIRKDLAAEYHAEAPSLTKGILLRIVAEAAYEAYEKGRPLPGITPLPGDR